ncbi:MAG: hypothetical protein AAB922_02485 [Patescibacteria group bacterium]
MEDTLKLISYKDSLNDFVMQQETEPYEHMGAVVVDGILQSSLNYLNVVKPRVNDVLKNYPESKTTSTFLETCDKNGLKNIIRWKDDKKPDYILALLRSLKDRKIETVTQLKEWLDTEENLNDFVSENKGIGDITAQYFRILIGSQSVKVDRHIRKFLGDAGIDTSDDKKSRDIVMLTAQKIGVKPVVLDYSIWKYQSSKSLKSRR